MLHETSDHGSQIHVTQVPVLTLDKLTVTAAINGQKVEALRGLDFRLNRGKVLGIVGESGAGKSMLARLISGLLPEGFGVTSGRMAFDGQDMSTMSPAARRALLGRKIAFIPQEPLTALNPLRTIGSTFFEHLARLGVAPAKRTTIARDALEAVQLPVPDAMLKRFPHQLSGGQCQRVLIAMAFASQPALLIADEPTTALDVITQSRVMRMLAHQQKDYATAVVLITHDLRMAAHVCDEIAVLYAGDIVEYGPARAVLEAPRHPYTRALKGATPDITGAPRRLPVIPLQMPGLSALASLQGCRFLPRCPSADLACASTQSPRVVNATQAGCAEHRVACSTICEQAVMDDTPVTLEKHTVTDATQDAPGVPRGRSSPVAELRSASLIYTSRSGVFGRRRTQFEAVKPLSLQIYPGEFVGIVGESGSGKTSVAKLLMGIEHPTDGRVVIAGEDVTYGTPDKVRRARERVQIIFQDPQSALNPKRNVERLLTQVMEAAGVAPQDAAERRARATTLQNAVGLSSDCLTRYPSQLSGGQKQRVNIGRALCSLPSLIVADEIVSGLDVSVQAQILNLLLDLRREHEIALLLISHDLSVVRYLCSRVLVMRRGEVVEQGDTERVFTDPQHPYTRSLIEAVPSERAGQPWPPTIATDASDGTLRDIARQTA